MSHLQKLRDRLKWAQEAQNQLSIQPTETPDPQTSSVLSTFKSVMVRHLELECEFLQDAIDEEMNA